GFYQFVLLALILRVQNVAEPEAICPVKLLNSFFCAHVKGFIVRKKYKLIRLFFNIPSTLSTRCFFTPGMLSTLSTK
ncbi:hypothetical protein HMPREF9151_00414, partial [Hoylesella saccharolytica F0055]